MIGTPFVVVLLAWGWIKGRAETIRLGLWWTTILAAISIGLKFTGDLAAEESSARLEPVRAWVERHEQSADQATTAMFLLGLAAAASVFLSRRGRPIPRWAAPLVLVLGLATSIMLARTANAGGKIGRPYLRPGASESNPVPDRPSSN